MSGYHYGLATRHQVKQKDIYSTFTQQKRFRMSFKLLGLVLVIFVMSNIRSQENRYKWKFVCHHKILTYNQLMYYLFIFSVLDLAYEEILTNTELTKI